MYNNKVVKEDTLNLINNIDLKEFKGKSILVAGATGMIAKYLVFTFMRLNDEKDYNIKLYLLGRNEEKLNKFFENRDDIKYLVQDVRDEIKIDDKLDIIYSLAGDASAKKIKEDPISIIEANVIGNINLLNLAKEKDAKIIFVSTREIYGDVKDTYSIKEEDMGAIDPTNPRSSYPESKRMAENLIVSYNKLYDIDYRIIRLAHSYGPGMGLANDGRVMSDFLNDKLNGRDIILKSKGEQLRAFCYLTDCIKGILLITLSKEEKIFNLSNETEEIKIRDLAKLIADTGDDKVELVFEIENDTGAYVNFKRVKLDNSRVESIGWKPDVKLKDGIKRTLEFFNSQKNT